MKRSMAQWARQTSHLYGPLLTSWPPTAVCGTSPSPSGLLLEDFTSSPGRTCPFTAETLLVLRFSETIQVRRIWHLQVLLKIQLLQRLWVLLDLQRVGNGLLVEVK